MPPLISPRCRGSSPPLRGGFPESTSSASDSNFNPRNTPCIHPGTYFVAPAIKIFVFLDLVFPGNPLRRSGPEHPIGCKVKSSIFQRFPVYTISYVQARIICGLGYLKSSASSWPLPPKLGRHRIRRSESDKQRRLFQQNRSSYPYCWR